MRITRLTQEFVADICAGFGLGLFVSAYAPIGIPLKLIVGSLLIATGAALAYAAQQRARDSDL